MHTPTSALPGAPTLYLDPAAQAVSSRVFGVRDATYRLSANFVEAFIAPTLTNSWANYGSGNNTAGYTKDSSGIVRLRGLMRSGTVGQAIFTLPVGYRPALDENMACPSNNAFGYVNIAAATGLVLPVIGSNVWFSLDGITFKAA